MNISSGGGGTGLPIASGGLGGPRTQAEKDTI